MLRCSLTRAMRNNLFPVAFLSFIISIGFCENYNHLQDIQSRGFVSTFIKYLDLALDYIFQTVFGTDSRPIESGNEYDDVSEERGNNRVSYKSFQFLRIWPRTDDALEELRTLSEQSRVQLWLPLAKNMSVDVVVPPSIAPELKDQLQERDVEFSVLSTDLEKIITNQIAQSRAESKPKSEESKNNKLTWTQYHTLDDIYSYLEYLQDTFEDLVEVITIGKSAEGREIKLIRISTTDSSNSSVKPAVWIDGGLHAREWISVAVALFVVRQLVEFNKSYKNLIQDLDWYILPVANPDGYVYTHTTDRLWTKSRSLGDNFARYFFSDDDCKGVDLNRNWDYRWNEENEENPCKEAYPGTAAFSEPETRSISNFILEHRDKLIIFLTLHSYSQMWLMPSNPTKSKSNDYDDLLYMGRRAIESLKKAHGTNYDLATKETKLYPISGTSDDWAKNKVGIKYSYSISLRDKGTYGFLLPPTQILPTAKETFTAIRTLTRSVLNNQLKLIKIF